MKVACLVVAFLNKSWTIHLPLVSGVAHTAALVVNESLHAAQATHTHHTVGQIRQKCKETSNLMWLWVKLSSFFADNIPSKIKQQS